MTWLIVIAGVVVLCLFTAKFWRAVGYGDGFKDGYDRGARAHLQTIGAVNVALGSLSILEIADALNSRSPDKIGALLGRVQHNGEKALLDAKARVAEWLVGE